MSNANYKKYCWYSLAVAVAVSIYPLCMGMTCPQCMFQLVVEKALGFAVVAEALECA